MPFRTLSRGMKRRLTVAAALVHSPDVLILDEPTAGLDVPSARQLRAHVRSINQDGTTVLLTTHNLLEASELCTRILILIKGRIVAEGSASEISERVACANRLSVEFSGDVEEALLSASCPAIVSVSQKGQTLLLDVNGTHSATAQLISFAEQNGVRVLHISSAPPSLEDAFVTILKEHGEHERGVS